MRLRRLVAVVVLVAVLSTSVAAGNAVVAAERTALSAPFVTSTLAEAGAYATARDVAVDAVTGEGVANATGGAARDGAPSGLIANATGRVVEEAVTEAYVEREVERNVGKTYAYLHGDRETLVVAVNASPVQSAVVDAVAEEVREASVAELLAAVGAEGASLPVAGTTVNLSVVGELGEGPTAYRETRSAFRADVRAGVVERLADRTFEAASDDERLALVVADYDPDAYTAEEKAAMVAAREAEIRAAIRQRVETRRADEVDAAVDRALDRLAAVEGETVAAALGGDVPAGLAAPVGDLVAVGLEALATDMPYETYVAETDDAKARLASGVAALVDERIAEAGTDRVVLADASDPATGEGLRLARRVVGAVDVAAIALPLLAAALVGALWWLTRSPAVTAGGTGLALVLGGLPGVVLPRLAAARLSTALAGGELPPALAGVVRAVLDRVLGAVVAQSLGVVVVGAALLAVAAYLRTYGTPAWLGRAGAAADGVTGGSAERRPRR